MKFEELQVIWNTQDQRPLFAVNETVVQERLWRQRQTLRRTWFRWNIMTSYVAAVVWGLLIAAYPLLFGVVLGVTFTRRTAVLFIASAVVLLYFVVTIIRDRLAEKRREGASGGSLREELERSIANLEYQIRAGGGSSANKKAIPLLVSTLLASLAMAEVTPALGWFPPLVGGSVSLGFLLELLRHRRRVNRDLLPKKQTLESLRDKLDRIDGGH